MDIYLSLLGEKHDMISPISKLDKNKNIKTGSFAQSTNLQQIPSEQIHEQSIRDRDVKMLSNTKEEVLKLLSSKYKADQKGKNEEKENVLLTSSHKDKILKYLNRHKEKGFIPVNDRNNIQSILDNENLLDETLAYVFLVLLKEAGDMQKGDMLFQV